MRRKLVEVIRNSIIILSITILGFYILAMLMTVNAYTLAFLNSTVETLHYRISIFPLYIGPVFVGIPLFYIYRPTFSEMFVALLFIYALCLLITLLHGRSNIFDVIKEKGNPLKNSYISVVSLTSATLIVIVIIDLLQQSVGIETGELISENELFTYLSVSMAPVVEEIGFRFFILGVFAVFLYLSMRRDLKFSLMDLIVILFNPGFARRKIENRLGRDALWRPLMLMVFISAILFGSIHYIYGGGWEIGKVTTASLAGILLGYLYIEFGLPAAILSHYTFNHFFMTYYYISEISNFPYVVDFAVILLGIFTIGYIIINRITKLGEGSDEDEVTIIEI